MSRIGKQNIKIPEKTTVTVDGPLVTVKGPLGELSRSFKSDILIAVENGEVTLKPNKSDVDLSPLWGTYGSHIANMVKGVNAPYQKKLIIEGVGFRAEASGNKLTMQLGFSHPVVMEVPAGITLTTEKGVMMISGIDKELVGQFAARVRDQKPPEPYKGKGIRYDTEVIRRKEGKRAA